MQEKERQIVDELQRVAKLLGKDSLSQKEFGANSSVAARQVINAFGSWTSGVMAAGLKTAIVYVPSDAELIQEMVRLSTELSKEPTDREMDARGKFSSSVYHHRWGSFTEARRQAYLKLGRPTSVPEKKPVQKLGFANLRPRTNTPSHVLVPDSPTTQSKPGKALFGEPVDFRGLRHAPLNEQGVVYLFGMVSRELGFLIESVRTGYPDCEGKRCVDTRKNHWQSVLIEFEFVSSNFVQHGHDISGCDLIVCWEHDWQDCPIEVLELKSAIKLLPNK